MARSKSEKMIEVAECTLNLVLKFGINELTFSRVSRAAEVSRPWLYKYIGNRREDLIAFAVNTFGKLFTEMESTMFEGNPDDWVESFVEGLDRLLAHTDHFPSIIPLYLRYRGTDTELGKRIDLIESAYFSRNSKELGQTFKIDTRKAHVLSQILTSFQAGLAHAWITGDWRKSIGKNEILRLTRKWLKAVATK